MEGCPFVLLSFVCVLVLVGVADLWSERSCNSLACVLGAVEDWNLSLYWPAEFVCMCLGAGVVCLLIGVSWL